MEQFVTFRNRVDKETYEMLTWIDLEYALTS